MLIPAVLGCPEVPIPLPDAWRTGLLQQHLDPDSRLSIFRTCRSGRDWVVQGAAHATLTLSLNGPIASDTLALSAARQALQRRAPYLTQLRVSQTHRRLSSMLLLPGLLHSTASLIHELHFDLQGYLTGAACTALVTASATALPHLRKLYFRPELSGSLPPLNMLLHVTDLAIGLDRYANTAQGSIATYLPQLTSLTLLCSIPQDPIDLSRIFSPAGHTTRLQHLSIDTPLTDHLLACLLQCTPSIQQLFVHSIHVHAAQHSTATWQLQRLVITDSGRGTAVSPEGCGLPKKLARLPFSPQLTISCPRWRLESVPVPFYVFTAEGLLPTVKDRLHTWVFEDVSVVTLFTSPNLPSIHQPAALTAALRQLQDLRTTIPCTVELDSGWADSGRLALNLRAVAAALPKQLICVTGQSSGGTWDTCLHTLLTQAPWLMQVKLPGAGCLLNDYSDRQCAWQSVVVLGVVALVDLARLPVNPNCQYVVSAGGGVSYTVTEKQVQAGVVESLLERLASDFTVTFSTQPWAGLHAPHVMRTDHEADLLRVQLQLLQAVCAAGSPPAEVQLRGWSMSAAVVAELGQLPNVPAPAILHFPHGPWRHASPLSDLVSKVPLCYTTWKLQESALHKEQVFELVRGLAEFRGSGQVGEWKLTVEVHQAPWLGEVRGLVEEVGLQGCVTITGRYVVWLDPYPAGGMYDGGDFGYDDSLSYDDSVGYAYDSEGYDYNSE